MVAFGSVHNYIQGPELIDKIGFEVSESVGTGTALLLVDKEAEAIIPRLEKSLHQGGIEFIVEVLDGELSMRRVDQCVSSHQQQANIKTTIGVGSGLSRKAIDFSKLVARRIDARNVALVTEAPSDGAPSHAAVAFGEDGTSRMMFSRSHAPDLVLVDSKAIASAPVRAFSAGIADAVCKKYEFETALDVGGPNFFGSKSPFFIRSMAEELHCTLLNDSIEAVETIRSGKLSDAVERVISAMMLLSSLVWENGGYVGAHGIATTLYNSGYCKDFLHGEHVAFGLLVLLILQDKNDAFQRIERLFGRLGLPRKISTLGIIDEERIRILSHDVHKYWRKQKLYFDAQDIERVVWELEKQ